MERLLVQTLPGAQPGLESQVIKRLTMDFTLKTDKNAVINIG